MKKITLSAALIAALSSLAIAGGDIAPVEPVIEEPMVEASTGGFYLGLGYSFLSSDLGFTPRGFNSTIDNVDTDHHTIMFQAGYKFNDYVALEGRYWYGISDDAFDFNLNTTNYSAESDAWGIYVKPMYPVTEAFTIYGLLGYGEATVTNIATSATTAGDITSDGFSWGIGADYAFSDNWSIFLDYVAFDDSTVLFGTAANGYEYDHAMDSVNFGVTYQF